MGKGSVGSHSYSSCCDRRSAAGDRRADGAAARGELSCAGP
ncbi:hypothetical protein SHJG_2059 [Streptomyces hygroscopicus subsp. jinggangensis 5008]|nr:hypothetical protein SHJG_2059 [Streptomyces hygroscopicus subsp. jinggangensis 5008]AGF61490.1 hypothetical protein SHJGH_1824 [Streptomyces hygroscopicus subsp. jinggangensis TL01]